MAKTRPLRILTWHVHGNYLYYLTQVPHAFFLVTDATRSTHHSGRSGTLPWGDNVHEVQCDALADAEFDLVLYQSRAEFDSDRVRWLSAAQRALPSIYLEHDPPQGHPTDSVHWAAGVATLLVQVTAFNALMWDAGDTPTHVVEHGVLPLGDDRYRGELEQGLVVVNNLDLRGRRLGADIFAAASRDVPLRLVGMGAERIGAFAEVPNHQLPGVMAAHRFFFNPIRYTSLGLAVIEAMMVGMPIVGMATTELVTVIRNGHNGHVDTRLEPLVETMRLLLRDAALAREWGDAARRTAQERFGIGRFVADWLGVFADATS